ncbi:MAG: alpha/beta hydrolase fold domain-containing protein [Acidimicrobiales bacterium]
MSVAFLIVSLVGLVFTLNALRPVRFEPTDSLSFLAGWLTSELPLQHLVWQVAATVAFGLLGAFGHTAGRIGLVLAVLNWLGLVVLNRQQARSAAVLAQALADVGRPGPRPLLAEAGVERRPSAWRRFLLPFWLGDHRISVTSDIAYGPAEGRSNLLDVYRRRDQPVGCPVYFYIHGGGWIIGDKKQQGMPLIKELAARGWVCVSINYRLSPKATFPEHLIDAKKALAWVRENIGAHGGDPSVVVAGGGSAGGHLASLLALSPDEPEYQPGFESADTSVDAVISFFGVYDFTNRSRSRRPGRGMTRLLAKWVMKTTLKDDPDGYARASPLDRVNSAAPPFFVVHGRNDGLVPVAEARDFVAALRQVSAHGVAYAELPGTQHAFETFHSRRVDHTVAAGVAFAEAIRSYAGSVGTADGAGTEEVQP